MQLNQEADRTFWHLPLEDLSIQQQKNDIPILVRNRLAAKFKSIYQPYL